MRHLRETIEDGETHVQKVRHGLLFDDPIELMDLVCVSGKLGKFSRYMGVNPFSLRDRNGYSRDKQTWFGRSDLRDWDHLRDAITAMWLPGEDRVNELLAKIASHPFLPPRDLRRRAVWRDDGGDFDLDRFCDGKDSFRAPKRREVIGRQFLTFVVDVSANCTTSADNMYWRAAVAIACMKTLEEFGYGVELIAYANLKDVLYPPGWSMDKCNRCDLGLSRSRGGFRQDVYAGVWVKRPDDPIDLGMLTAVCSPWFFRLGFFCMFGLIPNGIPRFSLGHCTAVQPKLVEELIGPDDGDRERVILANVWRESDSVALLRSTLRKFADAEWLADNPEPGQTEIRGKV